MIRQMTEKAQHILALYIYIYIYIFFFSILLNFFSFTAPQTKIYTCWFEQERSALDDLILSTKHNLQLARTTHWMEVFRTCSDS